MVRKEHRGRFATGCLTCRQRKIKCDETKPSCTRCVKARWKCPGYKEVGDLVFRNQYVTDPRKPFGTQHAGIKVQPSHLQTAVPKSTSVNQIISLPRALPPDPESVALSYFLSYHIINDSKSCIKGQYEYLSDLLTGLESSDGPLNHAINAAALAAFGNSHSTTSLTKKAHMECNLAIRALNTALQSPNTATKNSTLVSAMLLSTFETLSYTLDRGSCIDQLTGGLALLVLRGTKHLKSRFGMQTFLQAYFLAVTASLHMEHALPAGLSVLRRSVQPYLEIGNPSWAILDLMVKCATLLEVAKKEVSLIVMRQQLVISAEELDRQFQQVQVNMPPYWHPVVYQSADTTLVYEENFHIYKDPWVIRYWNYLRLSRILLHKIILENTCNIDDTTSAQFQTISATILQLSSEICATVPQHTSGIPHAQISSTKNEKPSMPPVAYTAGIYTLLYPLFALGRLKYTLPEMRKWIATRMEHLGRTSGISQGLAAAEVVRFEYPSDFT